MAKQLSPLVSPENDAEHALAVHLGDTGDHDADADDAAQSDVEKRERVQETVRRACEEAVQYQQATIEPEAKEATEYYLGRPFGNEVENRSKAVSTVVRDVTLSQIPSLARVLWGDDNVVEFTGRRPEKDEEAQQATEVVRYIITEDNPGFLSTIAVLKDGLVRRLGWWKWWWGNEQRSETLRFTGLTEEQVVHLSQDESVTEIEPTGQFQVPQPPPPPGPPGSPPAQPLPPLVFYDVRVTRREKRGRVYVAEVPPEEMMTTPNPRSIDEAPCVAHSRYVPQDFLWGRGYDDELIEDAINKTRTLQGDTLDSTRQIVNSGITQDARSAEALDESQLPVLFTEAYLLIQVEDDYGPRAERRLFECVGPEYAIANGDGLGECVDEVPFAPFTPEPEPHTLMGLSNWDLGKDLQKQASQILRHTFDSLAEAVNPVTVVDPKYVNLTDLTKPDASRVVRVRGDVNTSIREVKSTFVGPDTLPMLDFIDRTQEKRFGIDAASSGLDADALQSTDKQGVASVLSAKQQRLEMIARVYAEMTMARLYRGVLKLFIRHQDQPRWMRLRGKWTEVDPRSWDAMMDVKINVALGHGTPQDRLQAMAQVVGTTQQLIASGSPLVSNIELRRALADGYRLAGLNPDNYLKPWGQQEEQQYQQSIASQPPKPSPEEQMVQVEGQKAQANAAIDAEKLDLERNKIELEDDRERTRIAQEATLRTREMDLKYHSTAGSKIVDAHIAERRAQLEEQKIAATGVSATPAQES